MSSGLQLPGTLSASGAITVQRLIQIQFRGHLRCAWAGLGTIASGSPLPSASLLFALEDGIQSLRFHFLILVAF